MATIKKDNKETPKSQVKCSLKKLNNVSVLVFKGTNLQSEGLLVVDIRAMNNPKILNVTHKLISEYKDMNQHDFWMTAFADDVLTKISDELERISQV